MRAVAVALAAVAALGSAAAQQAPVADGVAVQAAPDPSPVLVIRQDQLFGNSAFGRASQARLDAASAALIAENRRIEGELEAEERALTDRRATLPTAEFRALADAFDAKVERIRAEQDAKTRELTRGRDEDRKRFVEFALPVLAELLRDRGAAVIIDQQAVMLSVDTVDITDEAVARIDLRIGDGSGIPLP
jgi:Skp family chaperone for outer membrane proteins